MAVENNSRVLAEEFSSNYLERKYIYSPVVYKETKECNNVIGQSFIMHSCHEYNDYSSSKSAWIKGNN
jgi:hypothetical protein